MSIITSLLDTDYYKFTMMQFVYYQFPDTEVEYTFKCRTPNIDLSLFVTEIKEEIKQLCQLELTLDELSYLNSLGIFKNDFLGSLCIFKLNYDHIQIKEKPFSLTIKGPWYNTILFETPILAIISEVYTIGKNIFEGYKHLDNKINLFKDTDIKFADFGTRRRYSYSWHHVVLIALKNKLSNQFIGTSNVFFSMKHNLKPIGTNLTNDVGINPLQIVIKMISCNGKPVAKISDSVEKGMCEDQKYLDELKRTFKID